MKVPIYITSNQTYIRKSGDSIIIDNKGNKIPCPTESVNYVIKYGNSQISEQMLNFFADKGIIVMRFSYGNKYNGMFLPPESNIGKARLLQYKAYFDNEQRLFLAKEFVKSSTKNKINLLRKHYYKDKEPSLKKTIEQIKKLSKEIGLTKEIDSLRGTEGIITKNYFDGFKKILKHYKPENREYHPPKDEINCLLSYGYSVLYAEILSKVYEHGLCPFLGYLHEQNDGQLSLVYDISECFKQMFIDRLIISLCNNNQLKEFHFNKKPDGSCLLSTIGKQFFLKQWIKFLRSTLYDSDKKDRISYIEIIRKEVIKVKSHLLGEGIYSGWEGK